MGAEYPETMNEMTGIALQGGKASSTINAGTKLFLLGGDCAEFVDGSVPMQSDHYISSVFPVGNGWVRRWAFWG